MSRRAAKDVDKGLEALVLAAGNAEEASRETGIAASTLKDWRSKTYRERYEALRRAHEETVDRELGEDLLNATRRRVQMADKTLDEYEKALEKKDYEALKALSAADKNLLVGTGIANQNSRIIREKPTEISEQRYELSVVEKAIRSLEGGNTVDGTAVELDAGSQG